MSLQMSDLAQTGAGSGGRRALPALGMMGELG